MVVSPLRPLSALDLVFLTCLGAFAVGLASRRLDRAGVGRVVLTPAWASFAVFWAVTAASYLGAGRAFLGAIATVTAVVVGYTATLVWRADPVGWRLTTAFTVMGLVFAPFQFLTPVHEFVLATVAAHTVAVLSLLGFDPVVGYTADGVASVVLFSGRPLAHAIEIVSACTGISGIALFWGLVVATDAPWRRRLVAAVGVGGLIYVLNLWRAAFVAGAMAGEWFAVATPLVGPLVGVTDPALVSYYVAELALAQLLVVLVLVGVYLGLSRWLPELGTFVEGVLDAMGADLARLGQR